MAARGLIGTALAVVLGTAMLTGCGASQPTLIVLTPQPSPVAVIASAEPSPPPLSSPSPRPTSKPKPTPKPLYSVVWLTGACAALGHLGTAVDHLSAVRVYLSSGDWGGIRLQDFAATEETFPAIQALSDDWKPGRGFNRELLNAAIAVQHAASQWDLAATFMTV